MKKIVLVLLLSFLSFNVIPQNQIQTLNIVEKCQRKKGIKEKCEFKSAQGTLSIYHYGNSEKFSYSSKLLYLIIFENNDSTVFSGLNLPQQIAKENTEPYNELYYLYESLDPIKTGLMTDVIGKSPKYLEKQFLFIISNFNEETDIITIISENDIINYKVQKIGSKKGETTLKDVLYSNINSFDFVKTYCPEKYEKIKLFSENKWSTNYEMVKFTIDNQCDAYVKYLKLLVEYENNKQIREIIINALVKWTENDLTNYEMVVFTIENQIKAKNSY